MRFGKWTGGLAGSALVWATMVALAPPAVADGFTLASGSVFDTARGCSSVSCGTGTETLSLQAPGAASGTIALDTTAMTIEFVITAIAVTLEAAGDDNGVAEMDFTDTTYSANNLFLLPLGGGLYAIGPNQKASVAGDQTQRDSGGSALGSSGGFASPNAGVTGLCEMGADDVVCGLSFGQSGFEVMVGDAVQETRYFQHRVDLVAVPEPVSLALLSSALVLAWGIERRRP